MNIKLIECKLISVPKRGTEYGSYDKEFAVGLAKSIKEEGLYNPIVIRPDPAAPGRYILVQGRHRYIATHKILKEQFISCNVIEDMDDADAEMAMISENLWQNPLSKKQHIRSLGRWHEHYLRRHPVGAAGGQAKAKQTTEGSEEPVNSEGTENSASEATETTPENTPFADMVSAATGQSKSSVNRDLRLAKTFSEEQMDIFEQMGTNQQDQIKMVKIKDKGQRDHVVNLVASGMATDDAIVLVLGDEASKVDKSLDKGVREEKERAKQAREKVKQVTEPVLTDDEWYETYCGEKANMFTNPVQFKAACLLFRKTAEHRQQFTGKVKKIVADSKKGGGNSLFHLMLSRVTSLSHPNDWLICGDCRGTGEWVAGKCKKCFGGGFHLKYETYL